MDRNAIEVVYAGEHVGWLDHFDGCEPRKHIDLEVARSTEWSDGFGEPHIESRRYHTPQRTVRIPDIEMAYSRKGAKEHVARLTAPYASKAYHASSASMEYTWQFVQVDTFDDFEWIFEHHCFVPRDRDDEDATELSEHVISGTKAEFIKTPDRTPLPKIEWPGLGAWGMPIRKKDALLSTSTVG